MPLNYQIEDVAQEVYSELDEPSNISVGAIKFWVRSQVGNLNTLLFTDYQLNDAGNEITPALGENEKAIIKSLYFIYWYNRMIRNAYGANGFSTTLELSSDGFTVRKLNKNEASKIFLQMVKDEKENLLKLVNGYRTNRSTPAQVTGNDILMHGLMTPDITYARVNRLFKL